MSKKLMRKKLALMLANLKKKRKYYCEVEFLESTETQWIDTGILPSEDLRTKVVQAYTGTSIARNSSILGSNGYNVNNRYWINYDNHFEIGYGNYSATNVVVQPNEVNTIDFNYIKNGSHYFSFNGTEYTTTGTPNTQYSIVLFGRVVSTQTPILAPQRIYKVQFIRNDVLIGDFIPVLDWDMTPCMYDKVSGQLFYNQGTGDFIAGREIHYVDYLESTGTQYINTGLLSTASSTVDTEFDFTSMESGAANNVGVFGGRNTTTANTFTFFKIASATPQYFRFDYNGQPKVATASDMTWNTSSKYRFQYNGTNCVTTNTTTGESVVLTRSPGSTFTQYPIHLFAVNTAGTIGQHLSGRIYYYKYSDGTKSVDMVPAIDENGVGYMLDRVSHTIYDNAGTGAFKYPAREVEYLQSDGARAIIAGVTVDDTCGYDVKWMALNSNDTIILGTKGSGDSRWVLSGSNNPNVNLSWNKSYGSAGLGLNKIQTAQMNYMNDRKRILNDTPIADITETLSSDASTYNVGVFGGYWGASYISLYATCRIYYAKITKGTELIRDFIPMVKDGSPCLFDKIGGLYYFGTGTGTFTTGKLVEPEYE